MPSLVSSLGWGWYDDSPQRISDTDWLRESLPNEPSWAGAETARLAPILYSHGVDLLVISSGGDHPMQMVRKCPAYQVCVAEFVMASLGIETAYPSAKFDTTPAGARPPWLIVAAVGAIGSGKSK
ncbi:hypothetical protein CPB84DRAFT_611902 [Gymnopilus junonius]|uniref:Uncharacterized protein n=1 Tax=Gymnopilus junonius TaxID=109634 RepID=A0A9P5NSI8_GYMJU|nr:hypothetical protein CPB84DRAFT_611902 [Gymnopilus junonius]